MFMKPTRSNQALEYVRSNPGADAGDVCRHLGISRNHAANVLTGLEKRGFLTSRITSPTGSTNRRKFYVTGNSGQALAVAKRGQSLGCGPFGVLAAQVMT